MSSRLRTVTYFVAFIALLALLQYLAAWAFGSIGFAAQYWLEYFASRDMEELAIVAAAVIAIGGFIAIVAGIVRVENWQRDRKMRRPLV